MKLHVPRVQEHCTVLQIPDILWITKFLLSMYLYSFSLKDCIPMWDYILTRGTVRSFVEITTSILDHMQDQLLLSSVD
jgi:hypothetical protein